MKISIIVPTLNESSTIGRLIPHILAKNEEDKEVIVVDGGSTDGTLDVVKSLNVKLLSGETSRAKQMNLGANNAIHPNLYFLHADTLPPLDFLEDFKKVLASGKMAMAYRSHFVGGSKMLKINALCTRFNQLVFRGGDQSLFVTKEVFNDIGQFDEKMEIMEEYPFIEQLLERKILALNPKKINISTRKYDNATWLKVSRANYVAYRMYQKGLDSLAIKKRYTDLLK